MAALRLPRCVCTQGACYEKHMTAVGVHVIDLVVFFSLLDNEKVVELLQAIKEKSITLDTIRHAPHPLCKSPPAHISGEKYERKQDIFQTLVFPRVPLLDGKMHHPYS